MLLVDDSVIDDHSTVSMSAVKMEELGFQGGDTILLKGKKRKTTIAIVNIDENISDNCIRVSKIARSNLR